jgi:hypothetical protein
MFVPFEHSCLTRSETGSVESKRIAVAIEKTGFARQINGAIEPQM